MTSRLTPEGTFVVQLRSNSDAGRRRLLGRIEHVMSGQSERFESLEELLAFMSRCALSSSPTAGKAQTARLVDRKG